MLTVTNNYSIMMTVTNKFIIMSWVMLMVAVTEKGL
jgi:hypothetical protein